MIAIPDDVPALSAVVPVSRETMARLQTLVTLLQRWQSSNNLLAEADLDKVWSRHVADSAELVRLFPRDRRWLDMGSGAGFPGLVVAIAGAAGTQVELVESNRRKCAFLRAAIRETGANARVHDGRIEAVIGSGSGGIDRISARALAPLGRLLELASPLMMAGVPAAFHKGRGVEKEIADATQTWDFDLIQHDSRIGGGVILEITRLRRRHT